MKVLHINTEAVKGGAAIAASRHSEAMRIKNIDSHVLSLNGIEDNNHIIYSYSSIKRKFWEKTKYVRHKLTRLIVRNVAWHWAEQDLSLSCIKEVQEADVIYLHWVNEFLSYNSISELLETKKRIIWFLHDMWPITGGCHYSFDCKGFEKGCYNCPQMKILNNLSHNQLNHKIKAWSKYDNLYIASPSVWLSDCIRLSEIFKSHKVFTCPNVINTNNFKPMNKNKVRTELGLPIGKKLILFSAISIHNPFKGTQYLFSALSKLAESDYEFIVVGDAELNIFPKEVEKKIHLQGFINDSNKMNLIYNSADVLLITSLAENFPNVVIEAMSCGVPIVGFSTGGIKDQIEHKKNGYLVEAKDIDGLVSGIHWVLDEADYSSLSEASRKYVIDNCSYEVVMKNHRLLLEGIL